MTTPALRPRSATEIIDVSFQILRHNYGALVTLSLASMLPMAAVTVIAGAGAGAGVTTVTAFDALKIISFFASFVFYFVAQNSVMVGASQAYLGEPVRAGVALARAVRRVVPLMLLSFILYIGVIIGMLFFIFPGIYLALRWAPLPMVTVLEDGDPGQTLKRVWALSRDNALHIFVILLVLLCIYIAVAFISLFLLSGSMVLGPAAAPKAGSILYYAVLALFFPFFQMVFVALYYDLRIRHEGLDVEMMTQALGEAAPQT